MKNNVILSRLLLIGLFVLGSFSSLSAGNSLKLWYSKPARQWEACLPLGNGRLGAMPDGGVFNENIVLNDITLWSGGKQDADKKDAAQYLPEIKRLLLAGQNRKAQEVMGKHFVCEGPGSGQGNGADYAFGCYQVLGNMHIKYYYDADSSSAMVGNYNRQLLLDSALACTEFNFNNINYKREYFTSFSGDVILIRLTADKPGKINFSLSLDRPEKFITQTVENELRMKGRLNNGSDGNGMQYLVRVRVVQQGGTLDAGNSSLHLKNANTAIIYIAAGTDFKDADYINTIDANLINSLSIPYDTLKNIHVKKYNELFSKARLHIQGKDNSGLPTDERLMEFANKKDDTGLPELYFQFGRYLLICSTRPNLLPPNLQGLWANTIRTPWNGDYHLNINIQMNHWPLDVTNLGELNAPFFNLVKGLTEPGEKTAKAYYAANGWVTHVITNLWGFTSPGEDYTWGAFNTGSAWLCQMLWTHYEFTQDANYLRELYPILKGSAEFYLSMLVKEPSHNWLVTAPSNSPENSFLFSDGKPAQVCVGSTIDNQLLHFLFSATLKAAEMLDDSPTFRDSLNTTLQQLAPSQIGHDGRLMEWLQEYKETDAQHRHVSHLWGLYPGAEISSGSPALREAAIKSLNLRGDSGTGWSLAWKINFWARLHDGDRAFFLFTKLLNPVNTSVVNMSNGGGTYPNLFCAHPPFQIDGNFGGAAGIAEMLLQSHNGYIELLPALPSEWKSGSFEGLCVRGGAELNAEWNNGKVESASLHATADNVFRLKLPSSVTLSFIKINDIIVKPDIKNNLLEISLNKNDVAVIKFE